MCCAAHVLAEECVLRCEHGVHVCSAAAVCMLQACALEVSRSPLAFSPPESLVKAALGRWSCSFVTTQGTADVPVPGIPTSHHLPTLLRLFVMETNPDMNLTCPLSFSLSQMAAV